MFVPKISCRNLISCAKTILRLFLGKAQFSWIISKNVLQNLTRACNSYFCECAKRGLKWKKVGEIEIFTIRTAHGIISTKKKTINAKNILDKKKKEIIERIKANNWKWINKSKREIFTTIVIISKKSINPMKKKPFY